MLTPEYLQNVPDNMIKLYAQAEADILADMARRISTYDYWIPAVEHQTKMLEEAGMVREDILARLKKLTGKTKKELRELMQDAGNVALKSDDEVYKRNGLDPPPIGASKDLQQILQAGYDKTAGTFQNLTMTTVRTATRQFEQALDRAYMQITMGGMDYNTSIRRAIKQLSADGVGAIKYPSGRVDSIEVAVRRALVTGVNQTALRLQDARADEVGSDLVEVSAHSGARPEHAKWQGGIYSRSGKSKKYPGLVEVTGYGTALGLGGINCSHSYRPWFEGMSRAYSEGLLEEYEARNFEYNGKKLTEYEALQEQRKIERNIRRWKREQNAMAAAGQDVSEAAAKVREWNATHRDFLEQTGLKPDGTRLAVGKGGTMSSSRQTLTSKTPSSTLKVKSSAPVTSVKDATDFAGLEKYFTSTYNVKIDTSVNTLDFTSVKEALEGMESVMQEYPDVGKHLTNVLTGKTGIMSCTGESLTFNPKNFDDLKYLRETCKNASESGWWPKNSTIASIGAHEAGHGVEWALLMANNSYTYHFERIMAWNKCVEAKQIVSQACKNIKKTAYGKGKKNAELIQGVSKYASANASETMAEAFADVFANGVNANPLSVEIKKLVAEQMKKYKGAI